MKRPFCVMAALFILGEMAYQLKAEGPAMELLPLIAGILIMVVSSRFARKRKCGNLLLFLCLVSGFVWAAAPVASHFAGDFEMQEFAANSVSGRTFAYVRKCEETSGGRYKLILKAEPGDLVCYVDEEIEPGSFLLMSCTISSLDGATNPGALDMEEYYAGLGIKYKAEITEGVSGLYLIGSETGDYERYEISPLWYVRSTFVKLLYRFRKRLGEELDKCYDSRDAGLLKAILLGDKSDFDVTDKLVFQRAGLSHIFAISGMHITLVALGVEWLLTMFGMTKKKRAFVSIGVVFTYAVMTGLSAATVRALVMYVVSRMSFAVGRTTDAPTSMMTALFIIVVVSPGQIFSSGVLMSFLSLCGLYSGQRLSNHVLGRYGARRGRVGAALRAKVKSLVERSMSGGEEKVQYGRRGEVLKGRDKLLGGSWENETEWRVRYASQIKFWKSIFSGLMRSLAEKLIISGSINLWMLPAVIYLYYEVPVFAMLLNLVLLPLLTFLVAGGSLTAVLGLFWDLEIIEDLQKWVALPVQGLLHLYRFVCYGLNHFHYATICTGHIPIWVLPILLLGPIGILLIKGAGRMPISFKRFLYAAQNKKLVLTISILLCYLVIAAIEIGIVRQVNRARSETVFMDVGQGDGSIIHVASDGAGRLFGRGRSYIVDFGSSSVESDMLGRYTLIPALKYYGVDTIDCIFMSHSDSDHVNGIIFLLENAELYGIRIENVAYAKGTEMDENMERIERACESGDASEWQTRLVELSAGDVVDGHFHILYPDSDLSDAGTTDKEVIGDGFNSTTYNEATNNDAVGDLVLNGGNDYSLVMIFEAEKYEVLYTGDISSEVESRILDRVGAKKDGGEPPKYKILKCPHHGSRYSSSDEFLTSYDPDLTVISCGENNLYGHPAEVTLSRLKNAGTKILRTDEEGAVIVE